MKRVVFSAAAVLAGGFVFAGSAIAARPGDVEVGAQYAITTHSESTVPDLNPDAVLVHADYYLNRHLSVQGRVSVANGNDEIRLGSERIVLKLKHIYAAYAVGHLPITGAWELYGMAGMANVKESATGTTSSATYYVSSTENKFSYGGGVRFQLNRHWLLGLEYVSYYSESSYSTSAMGVGASYRF